MSSCRNQEGRRRGSPTLSECPVARTERWERRKRRIGSHGGHRRSLAWAPSSATATATTAPRAAGIVGGLRRNGGFATWRGCRRVSFQSRLRGFGCRLGCCLGRRGLGQILLRVEISRLQRCGLSGRLFRRFFTPFQFLLHPFTHVGLVTYWDACGQLPPTEPWRIPHGRFWGLTIKCKWRSNGWRYLKRYRGRSTSR